MHRNLVLRDNVETFFRKFLHEQRFVEVETPILTKGTPEGAREFLVPSRVHPGKMYVLPQSPQQFKQLLMVGGVERYFQVARCFRDEDQRGDRQPEFTQLDMEMSFVDREDVMRLVEAMMIEMVKVCAPEKRIQQIPFPRLSYAEAMEKYGSDKPDLREDKDDPNLLAFGWVIDFPFFEKTEEGGWTFTHNPFSSPKPEHMEMLMEKKNIGDILTTQYDIVLNGYEAGGGSIRNHKPDALRKVFEVMGFTDEQINEQFGHMLEAFSFGAPPHGGIAPGLDRLIMILANEPNIREVIAIPKTGDARDVMMGAPSEMPKRALDDVHIQLK
jgi:aspartyl-tRNA synthetase